MEDNKHHWCDGDGGAVNMKLITHCKPGFKKEDHQSQFEDIPQR